MSPRHKLITCTVALALGAAAPAGAQDIDFAYLEGGFIASFVNDVEESGTITGNSGPLTLETDAGSGGFISGAFPVGEKVHLFGEYSSNRQDLEVSDGIDTVEGDFDVTRWRVGAGYASPVSPTTSWYGRLTYDNAEFSNVSVAGFNLDTDADESGLGGELGMVWAATPAIHLQGHVRYTSVGEVAADGSDTFDSDILLGVNGRWYFRPDFALVTGYEYGKITSFNVGLRYSF